MTQKPPSTPTAVRPLVTRSDDFDTFWEATLQLLADVPIDYSLGTLTRAPEGATLLSLRFRSLGDAVIRGWLLSRDMPSERGPTNRPLVVTTHGYNSQCNPALEARHLAHGVDLMCFDVRGCGLSRDACRIHPDGYVLSGLTDPETCVLRGAVCDYIRAAEVAVALHGTDPSRLAFHGRSFAGALALMAQAVSGMARYLAVSVPTFGWAEGRRTLVREGSGREINDYLADHPSRETAVMRTLSYFDTVNFASRVRCQALVGVGRRDPIVPPETVYAIVNHMSPRPAVVELPVSHTQELAEGRWEEFDRRWVSELVAGCGAP